MAVELASLADLDRLGIDEIIDVRSPSEYAEDHLPGAVNLPVLSDAERARVGTVYVQQDRFLARKLGAALVARNAAAHLEGPLADRDGGWRPLVYCWRGGQRSGSFASILSQIGWRVELLRGGYRSFRRLVVRALYDDPLPFRVVLVDGMTGTGKTEMLAHLAAAGAQVVDLEGLAAHRGSLFGAVAGGQPPQKLFESRLAMQLFRLDPARPVFVEAESAKVGERILPPALWAAMKRADHVRLEAPRPVRAAYLARAYADLTADRAALLAVLEKLAPYHGHAQVEAWQALARAGAFAALAEELIAAHYDPRYAKSARRRAPPRAVARLEQLEPEEFAQAARRIRGAVEGD
ncbi:tRNA 2-selenouridine(34) synthase MnmH [Rhodosalinus halophilus]|uniref:tRNA 2-selenouridine(34) synthase MnmH n=1 Tax=Rhodosalinus halophilus TaxID=2259333 RepID=A0A365UD68_9RHOB|nr:tRNA 2-selenouridine(34) synthase MnmH [Rhodosalinus halophilus]RBI86544.1 tRNA 2-selenouridine(34) synthase MnmH [Rhodosalinus halophilus]